MSKFYRINQHIQAPQLRVLDNTGQQLGVMSKNEALEKARELGLDLVEIASHANPPVVKLINFEKFKYEESKKERIAKRGTSDTGLKELWLSPRIAEHDLGVRLRRADEFLKEGHKVKLTVKFKGREMGHPQLGHEVLNKALTFFGDRAAVERDAKFEGRKLTVIIAKSKAVSKPGESQGETVKGKDAETSSA